MSPIIYLPGELADAMGAKAIAELGMALAAFAPHGGVDVLTHGPSKYHGERRWHCRAKATAGRVALTLSSLSDGSSADSLGEALEALNSVRQWHSCTMPGEDMPTSLVEMIQAICDKHDKESNHES